MGKLDGVPPIGGFAPLVPELDVLERAGGAQIMLCARNGNWETAPAERPLGRGINFEIKVERTAPILEALAAMHRPLFREPHIAWYRIEDHETGNRQFLVQDPDGYLVRLSEDLRRRPLSRP